MFTLGFEKTAFSKGLALRYMAGGLATRAGYTHGGKAHKQVARLAKNFKDKSRFTDKAGLRGIAMRSKDNPKSAHIMLDSVIGQASRKGK